MTISPASGDRHSGLEPYPGRYVAVTATVRVRVNIQHFCLADQQISRRLASTPIGPLLGKNQCHDQFWDSQPAKVGRPTAALSD